MRSGQNHTRRKFLHTNLQVSSSWLLVSKIIHTKRVACEEETEANEFAQVDCSADCNHSLRQANLTKRMQTTSLTIWSHAFKIRKNNLTAYLGS
ncbi:hypothetical protein CerSpe_286990 [Prunus speciosa]